MLYSVWNQAGGDFLYFDDGQAQEKLNEVKPTHLRERALGSTIDQAAWPLPASARPIGRGPVPVGRVAAAGGQGLGGIALGDVSPTVKAVLLAGAGLLAWHVLLRKKRTS